MKVFCLSVWGEGAVKTEVVFFNVLKIVSILPLPLHLHQDLQESAWRYYFRGGGSVC